MYKIHFFAQVITLWTTVAINSYQCQLMAIYRSKRIGLFADNTLHTSVFREIFYYINNFHDIKYFSMLNLSLLHSTLARCDNSISMVVNNIK